MMQSMMPLHLSLGVTFEHIFQMPNRGDVVIKDRAPLDDFGANALLEPRVSSYFHRKVDIVGGRLCDQIGHSQPA